MSFFNTKLHNTTVRREVISGISTFIAMSYILVLNPVLLRKLGMDYESAFFATVLSSICTTLISAFYTKMPLAYAPGVMQTLLLFPLLERCAPGNWRFMLLATYLSGLVIICISYTGLYYKIIDLIPQFIIYSLVGGVGLILMITGVCLMQIVEQIDEGGMLKLVLRKEVVYIILFLAIVFWLKKRNKRYAITIGIAVVYVLLTIHCAGVGMYENGFAWGHAFCIHSVEDFGRSFILQGAYQFESIQKIVKNPRMVLDLLIMVILITTNHFFDACGTGVVIATEIDKQDDNFDPDAVRKTMRVNGIGALLSSCVGTPSVTTYAESIVGIDVGGKTGISAIVVCIGFALSLSLGSYYQMMEEYIVAPAMLFAGYMYLKKLKQITFEEQYEKWISIVIVLYAGVTKTIGDAAILGLCLYGAMLFFTGRRKEISKYWPLLVLVGILCLMV